MKYWSKGIDHLDKVDKIFKKYRSNKVLLNTDQTAFQVLFNSVCSQQISTTAANSIQLKSKLIFKKIILSNFVSNVSKIENLPITKNKKKCIFSLVKYLSDHKNIRFKLMSDQEVYDHLINIFGIGPWTIQMFNIFYKGSQDIIPIKDLGFINSYKKFYKDPFLNNLNSNILLWKPYGTIVTMNLWLAYDTKPLDI